MKDIVLIPAYQPDEQLIQVVNELHTQDVGILVVDDGSGPDYSHIFDAIKEKSEIVHIPCNSGKGAALKNGMATIQNNHPECDFFVTADADGQHKCKDIMRVFDELHRGAEFVLTIRQFEGDMPFRSRFGNSLSRFVYTMLNSHYFADNQSGLRGFTSTNIEWLLRVEGNKYDYEMNMLYYADKQRITITTIPIEAIYINNNSSSHFNPVKDTVRIYAQLFYSARITFFSLILTEQLLILVSIFFGYQFLHITVPTIGATAVCFTILLNKFVVFRKFRYRDFLRIIIYSILRYIIYTWGTLLFSVLLPFIPLFFAFNFIAILGIPTEYFFHKLLYIAKYKDIQKS
ncbi:MAG: glycosyltransferase family 2 protein [Clostridia bacterium]|nr:glycosyltransferase family 2 protein [Clostridia bacterium]